MNNFMYIFSLGISNNSIYVIPLGVPNCKSMLLRIAELCLERLLSYYLRYNYSVHKLYNPALTKFSFFTFFFFSWKWENSLYGLSYFKYQVIKIGIQHIISTIDLSSTVYLTPSPAISQMSTVIFFLKTILTMPHSIHHT